MRSGQCMELVTGGSDMWIFIVFVCVTVTAIIIFVNYRRTKKTMDTIEEMLNVAVKGEFTEENSTRHACRLWRQNLPIT